MSERTGIAGRDEYPAGLEVSVRRTSSRSCGMFLSQYCLLFIDIRTLLSAIKNSACFLSERHAGTGLPVPMGMYAWSQETLDASFSRDFEVSAGVKIALSPEVNSL